MTQNENEFPAHIERLSGDHTVKVKILRMEGELKEIAKENPDLNVFYDEQSNKFKFVWTFLSIDPIDLPIDYMYNGYVDKQFILKQLLNAAYSHGYEQRGKEVIENLKHLLEL